VAEMPGALDYSRAASGQAGPRPGTLWASFGLPCTVYDGAAFAAKLKSGAGGVTSANDAGIFFQTSDFPLEWTALAREGEAAPGVSGAAWSAFKDPAFAFNNYAGEATWMATVKGDGVIPANDTGIWWGSPSAAPQLVAREGDEPAGVPGAQWLSFTSLALADGATFQKASRPLFVARLKAGTGGATTASDVGLWAVDSAGRLRLVVREGDVIAGKTVRTFTVLSVVPGSPGQTRSFNSQGQVIYRAVFTDASQALVQVQMP
jgi:hypothetical protein